MKYLIEYLKGNESCRRVPFWFMRQAGRYLPEYRKLRADAGSFLDLCYNPELACEVTLQPIRRFDMDAAIIFSDILVVADAMGMEVNFVEGKGPQLAGFDLDRLDFDSSKISAVYEAVSLTRENLANDKTLIGFAGAPWTLACYMIAGGTEKEYASVRRFAYEKQEEFSKLIKKLTSAVTEHLQNQIEAGVELVQIFDSWAGILASDEFAKWSIGPTKDIVRALRKSHPHVKIISFARNAGDRLAAYVRATSIDIAGIDMNTTYKTITEIQDFAFVQGNLDPYLLASDKEKAVEKTREILSRLDNKKLIFNLGHGFIPDTPVENVEAVVEVLLEDRG